MPGRHRERHRADRIGWLRAAVLGANDGLVSTASLMVGVAAANASASALLTTGAAGLVAGAMSMAAGEYVSVHTQADTEAADLSREIAELEADPVDEARELASLYAARGVQPELARTVAAQLMAHDALGAHARDELGLIASQSARPLQAALASAGSFALGAVLPLAVAMAVPAARVVPWIAGSTLVALALLGALAARAGGASLLRGTARVALWGALALGVTAGAGALFGAVV